MIALLILSLVINALVSFCISFGFYFIKPELSFSIFWITFGLMWVVMEPINRILRNKSLKQEEKTLRAFAKAEEKTGKQLIKLECEYCGEVNAVKIDLNSENAFVCKSCKNDNNVLIQFSTARTTIPMDSITPVDEPISKDLEEFDNE